MKVGRVAFSILIFFVSLRICNAVYAILIQHFPQNNIDKITKDLANIFKLHKLFSDLSDFLHLQVNSSNLIISTIMFVVAWIRFWPRIAFFTLSGKDREVLGDINERARESYFFLDDAFGLDTQIPKQLDSPQIRRQLWQAVSDAKRSHALRTMFVEFVGSLMRRAMAFIGALSSKFPVFVMRWFHWDIGQVGTPRVAFLRDWRPRCPTLMLVDFSSADKPKEIKSQLATTETDYAYPVQLFGFGAWPDVRAELNSPGAFQVSYSEDEFEAREWLVAELKHNIKETILRQREHCGVLALRAPMGWGKTAFSLGLVDQSRQGTRIVNSQEWLDARQAIWVQPDGLHVDGWAFARRERNEQRQLNRLSFELRTVVLQLDKCTRARLGLDMKLGNVETEKSASAIMADLIRECSNLYKEKQKSDAGFAPIVLLLDAFDELHLAIQGTDSNVESFLPDELATGVILVLTTRDWVLRSGNEMGFGKWPSKKMDFWLEDKKDLSAKDHEYQDHCNADLNGFITRRLRTIDKECGTRLEDNHDVSDHVFAAAKGYFIVAAGLLSPDSEASERESERKASFKARMKRWDTQHSYRDDLPSGPSDYFKHQIDEKIRYLGSTLPNSPQGGPVEAEAIACRAKALLYLAAWTDQPLPFNAFLDAIELMHTGLRNGDDRSREAWRKLWHEDIQPEFDRPMLDRYLRGLRGVLVTPSILRLTPHKGHHSGFAHPRIRESLREELHQEQHDNELQAVRAHWCALVKRYLESSGGSAAADEFGADLKTYLDRYGVSHLIDAGELAGAINLHNKLAERLPEDSPDLAAQVREIATAISAAANADDSSMPNTEDGRRKVRQWYAQLPAIEGKSLFDFLKHRLYLTGLYTAVLITLLRYSHRPEGWGDLATSFDACAANSDLVLRHDWGEAFASVWHDMSRRKEIEDELERMRTEHSSPGQDDLVAYLREIAGYALKHLWGDDLQPAPAGAVDSTVGLGHYRADVIRDYGGEREGYSSPTDRMIATELLLAHAIAHDDANPLTDLTEQLFRPKWDYHLCDVLDLGYVVAARNEESLRRYRESPDAFPGPQPVRERCADNHRVVLDLGYTLRNSEFGRRHPGLAELFESGPRGAESYQQQLLSANTDLDSRIRSLDHDLEELCRSKTLPPAGETRNEPLDAIKVLLSHPLWNVTEIVTTALTDVSWGWPPSAQARLIDSLLDPGNWKVRYGAVDLAFNLGERSGYDYAHFVRVVLHLHARNEAQCRVVGLMTEEVLSWLSNPWSGPVAQRWLDSDDHDASVLRSVITRWVGKPPGATLPDGWQRDSWQLENIYLLFSMLKSKNPQLMNKLLPREQANWNPVFLGDEPFYQLGHTAFLRRIESNWTGPTLGTGAL
ncbi:hypothetical protein CI15_23335 [Paraburkholderia monticola]|uniref:Uncharacterized protein n=2 Tax=Paraburkholderia monticola TaxID=1399968 RepID=A0A149PH58_9BURK|nr:hypothetical protein CI15_23335 [Paraburkholderia monticola]